MFMFTILQVVLEEKIQQFIKENDVSLAKEVNMLIILFLCVIVFYIVLFPMRLSNEFVVFTGLPIGAH